LRKALQMDERLAGMQNPESNFGAITWDD